ncbi:MAG TPA: DnaJ domain-containing protein [Candidatus Sulfotelmatobacter sp.]|jgi:curved DNA-binding protein CbpA|nr:DnaJ domain-containing protein [Candidatus Sulfotelmatobacter sp.]
MTGKQTFSVADPQGYYAVLGVGHLADAAEIKAAYRYKAKILHPDYNPSDDAADEFLKISEAWSVLRDARQRAAYDARARLPVPVRVIDPNDPEPDALCCSRCGKVTAQPRYIVFHKVKSFLLKTRKTVVHGIFCRDCADRTAIRASTVTWLLGWWGFKGPLLSLKALLANLRGGDRPREDNLRVLLHQARAFLARDEKDIARALAQQAMPFARNDQDRERIRRIETLAGTSDRKLKSRWDKGGYAAWAQALPLFAVIAALGVAVSVVAMQPYTDQVGADIIVHPAQAGETRHVAVEMLKVRQGPGASQPVVALLDRFATVQVMEGQGDWARILTSSGVTGYVPSRFLFGGPGSVQKDRWCSEQRGDPPENGDVLMRRSGGEHQLDVSNESSDDVVVRLKTPNGRTVLSFFVGADSQATIDGIPDGTFRAVFATGENYSRACGIYLDNMQTFIVPMAQSFQARPDQGKGLHLSLNIPDVGMGPGKSHPLPLESFMDN